MKPSGTLVTEPLHSANIAGKRSVLWDPQSMSLEPLHEANDLIPGLGLYYTRDHNEYSLAIAERRPCDGTGCILLTAC